MARAPYPVHEDEPLEALREWLISDAEANGVDPATLAALTEPLSVAEREPIVARLLREQARASHRTSRAARPRTSRALLGTAVALAVAGVLGVVVSREAVPLASQRALTRSAQEEPPSDAALQMQAALDQSRAEAAELTALGESFARRAMYERAEALFREALALREQVLGPHHEDVADSLSHLAGVYLARHEYEKAEPLYFRALEIRPPVAVF